MEFLYPKFLRQATSYVCNVTQNLDIRNLLPKIKKSSSNTTPYIFKQLFRISISYKKKIYIYIYKEHRLCL